jgi:AraC family transcriptional regulator of adaptative response/methylated-DNA-[protein]-cysteine methyltransferase
MANATSRAFRCSRSVTPPGLQSRLPHSRSRNGAGMKDSQSVETDDWHAINTRERRSDGRFVWVALSTNIYCRPSCGARRPERRKVVVLPTAADAERQGYSACRRCHPERTSLSSAESGVTIALNYIQKHADRAITLRHLSKVVGLSSDHFQRLFTRIVGMSPRVYCDHCRLARLKAFLRSGISVTDSAYSAGYGSMRALYQKRARGLGMTPATYKRGGAGVLIRYAILDAPQGRVLVAFTELGLCDVLAAESDDILVREISREVPGATLVPELPPSPSWGASARTCGYEDPLLSTLPVQMRRDIFRAKLGRALSATFPLTLYR